MIALLLNDSEVVYLPKNLNLDEQLQISPPMVAHYHKNPSKVRDKIAVILGQLMARTIHDKSFEPKADGFIPLNATVLQELVDDYRSLLDWAVQSCIIEGDGKYSPGVVSVGYRFSDNMWKQPRKYYVTDRTLIKKLRRRRVDERSIQSHPFLSKCLRELQIDRDEAEREMFRLLEENEESKLYARLAAIESLSEGRFVFRRDKTVHRLHTNVTGLKREARKYLTWNGESLINVDIKNSQPYFSLALFNKEAYTNLSIPNLLSTYNPSLSNTIMLGEYDDIFLTYRKEYKEVVSKGRLYEYMGEMMGIERREAKELIFNIFFSVPTWDFKGKAEFIDLFPEVWKVFKWINTGFYQTKKQGRKDTDQSNALAMLLQRIEATVVLDHIVPRIIEELPGLPIWTIHDSIMTVKGQEEDVARIMREEASRLIGVAPTLSYE